MKKPSKVIKNKSHYLKTCISNEVNKKIPIFDSYRNFCKQFGQNAMKYPDFEFWYYRFYHGQMDFDYDRSMDPVPKTIMDMPVTLMFKITENLDIKERINLRTMNQAIKDIVDSHAPIFDGIEISGHRTSLFWKENNTIVEFSQDKKGSALCTFSKSGFTSLMKKGLEYMNLLFKIPKIKTNCLTLKLTEASSELKVPNVQVNHLILYFNEETVYLHNLLPVPFHAKSLKPGELDSIHFDLIQMPERGQVLRFFETEQFKQAKHVQLKKFRVNQEDLVRFSHLKSFKFELNTCEEVDFQRIREMISTFEQLESCELNILNFPEFTVRPIGEALGADFPFGPLKKAVIHRYRIPESNEYLEFELEEKLCWCHIKIVKIR
ncbi:hypothetical protein B9Z55_026922 [Caenorhabditis nigoni]|uniref:F-box domain-containing protein n=1 Tax=Caenorhabditis nigoni TaxID=1611254 RepID=A0A2G5SI20_9PELO|nr:hypothetical protein B9Z55_026922 [Caenorhabditis nigoni]